MSHHLDSPLARQDPRLNITDQYVFDGDDATVFVLNVRTSLAGDAVPLGFHDEGRYEFKIHLDDADDESLTFRFVFSPEDAGQQAYRGFRLDGAEAADDAATGSVVAAGNVGTTADGPGGEKIWVGRVADPFYLDLSQLAAVDAAVQHEQDVSLTERQPDNTSNTFAGSTVNSIVLQIPHTDPALQPGQDIRVWSAAKLATDAGGWRQVGRTGLPMIWPIFRDAGSDTASHANETHPADDAAAYAKTLHDLIAGVVRRRGTSEHPDAFADLVTQRLIPDTLPYRVGSPAVFGFAGFNGRRLGDNAPEVMFSLATNSAVPTGLLPGAAADTRTDTFPFVVPAS